MSDFGGTLTGGIQDLSALLPLIGTEQCEKHIGSALDGGFFYAATAPLSLFGSPGIVKAGISVLIASISIPGLTFSRPPKFSLAFSGLRWCGARVLNDAGFKPMGSVAPMITMDKKRYAAESQLLQMLNEKHIDSPENLTIEWKSVEWNLCLVLFTVIAAGVSYTPYFHLVLGAGNSAWVFPLVRTLGSCLAAICCQFIIQARVISIMKSRIIFMVMHQRLLRDLKANGVEKPLFGLGQGPIRWDADLIAEECLWSLENYLTCSLRHPRSQPQAPVPSKTSMANDRGLRPLAPAHSHVSVPIPSHHDPFSDLDHDDLLNQLQAERQSHFPNPVRDWVFIISSWIALLLAIPAGIAGYIGSFTLASNSTSNGPAIWLGVEVALSVVRILLWAWNPRWDENTDITVRLKLTEHEPLVTTEKEVRLLGDTLPLIPEHRFLEFITRYTGPLERFEGHPNIVLYFTLSGTKGKKRLLMTALDVNKRMGFVLYRDKGRITYANCSIDPDKDKVEMQATLLSEIGDQHPWRMNYPALLNALSDHYDFLLRALNRVNPNPLPPLSHPTRWFSTIPTFRFGRRTTPRTSPTPSTPPSSASRDQTSHLPSAPLRMKWNFEPKTLKIAAAEYDSPSLAPLSPHDHQYLQRGHEHHLKMRLIKTWSDWVVKGMEAMRADALLDCHHVNEKPVRDKRAKELELDQLNAWVALEWQKHELVLLTMSMRLEAILESRMKRYIEKVIALEGREWMVDWLSVEWSVGWKKRLEDERVRAKRRMESAAKDTEGRGDAGEQWQESRRFIDEAWKAAIKGSRLPSANLALPWINPFSPDHKILKSIQKRLTRRKSPLDDIRAEMEKRIELIREGDPNQLHQAYHYPECSQAMATAVFTRFVHFESLSHEQRLLAARLSVATVHDVRDSDPVIVYAVIQNPCARIVVNIKKGLTIEKNDHLLYLSDDSREEIALPFIQSNRERWWTHQTANSSTFYFTPAYLNRGAVTFGNGTIAHLMIFLRTPTRLRIRLLHRRYNHTKLSIREGENELRQILDDEIPLNDPRLCDFELASVFEPGRHKLQLVVMEDFYELYDILVEFFDDASSSPPRPAP